MSHKYIRSGSYRIEEQLFRVQASKLDGNIVLGLEKSINQLDDREKYTQLRAPEKGIRRRYLGNSEGLFPFRRDLSESTVAVDRMLQTR